MIIIAADSLGAAPIIMGNELARRNHSILLVKIFFKKTYMCIYIYIYSHSVHMCMHYVYVHILWAHICVYVCVCLWVCIRQGKEEPQQKENGPERADVVELTFSPDPSPNMYTSCPLPRVPNRVTHCPHDTAWAMLGL